MKKFTSVLFFSLCSVVLFSQVPQVLFYGYIEQGVFEDPYKSKKKKEKAPEKIQDVKVFIYVDDSLIRTEDARSTGFYAVLLDAGQKYRVVFEKEGYFCKCFEMDCIEVQSPGEEGALKCLTDVSLFKKVDNDDLLSLCKVPYAKCKFDLATNDMSWDLEYTARAREKFYELAEPYYMAAKK